MRNKIWFAGLLAGAALSGAAVADEAKDQVAIAKQLPSAKVILIHTAQASAFQESPRGLHHGQSRQCRCAVPAVLVRIKFK
jgi:hypothetical protein